MAYFEIAGPDVQRLAVFYAQVFGWQARPGPFPAYWSLGSEVGTERRAGFRQEAAPERVLYVRVADLQQTLDQEDLGKSGRVDLKHRPLGPEAP